MADPKRMIALSMVSPLAEEVARQINNAPGAEALPIAEAADAKATQAQEDAEASTAAFDDRPGLVQAVADGLSRETAVAGGVMYRRADGLSLPSLNNWRPMDNTLDLRHVGSTSELSSDFVGRFSQAADDAAANGWDLRVSQKADGTPYEYRFIDHTLTGDLRVDFDRSALLMPVQNFQHFATNGTTGPFTITEFPYNAAVDGNLSAMLVSGATDTKFEQGVHFTVSGNVVTLTTTPPAGSTFVVVSRRDALSFRSAPGDGRRLVLAGDINIDISRYGYAIASASGSGLSTINVDHWVVERLRVYSPAGYGSPSLSKRGDSAFSPLTFKSGWAGHIHAEGMNDLAVYATGGGNSGPADDSQGLYIGSIYAKRCGTGMKLVRQGEQATVGAIHVVECGTGYLMGATNGLATGSGIHIGSINALRLGRRALDVRDMPQGGLHVGAISVRDIGFLPDGVTPEDSAAGAWLQGVAGVQIDYLNVRQRDWPTPANVPALMVSSDNNYGNRVLGGWVAGLSHGIRETGSTTNDVGNSYTLTMKDVPTPIDSAGALHTDFDLTLLTETAGVVTQKRVNSLFSERKTGTPTVLLPGATSSPTYSYTMQDLSYRRMLDAAHFVLRLQAQITHSESTDRQLRIYLPDDLTTTSTAAAVPVTLGRMQGLNLPANDGVFAEVAPGANYVRFYYRPTGSAPVEVNSSHITSGVNFRIEISGLIPV